MKNTTNKAVLLALMIGFSGSVMADGRGHQHPHRAVKVISAPDMSLDEAVERARANGHRVLKAVTRTRPNGKQVHVLKVRTRKGVVKRIVIK